MVLLIEGIPLTKCPPSTDQFFKSWPSVAEAGRAFGCQKVRQVEGGHTLYVGQGEYGVVPGTDAGVQVVGSDDATTCHMLVLRHPAGTVAVAHLDGSQGEEAALSSIVNKIMSIECGTGDGTLGEGLQVHVVGGYLPERGSREATRGESEQLSLKLLDMLVRHECHFQLGVWCTGSLNTAQGTSGPCPLVYGVGVEVQTGVVFPAHFKAQEPNMPLRAASRWMSGEQRPSDLYDHESGTITIPAFHYSNVDWFGMCLGLPDEVLLRNYSTSPKVEPPHFCQDLRRVFRVFVEHPKPQESLFPGNKPKIYAMNHRGFWELIHG